MKSGKLAFGRACFVVFTIVFLFTLGTFSISASAKMKINKKSATVYIGKTVKLKVINAKKKVKWKSSKKSIATVSKKGVVRGKKEGKVTITAKVGKKKFKCKVTVEREYTTKDYIIDTIMKHGKTDTDVDGFHYFLEYTDYDGSIEHYTTVSYYPNTGKIVIAILSNKEIFVYYYLQNINDSNCYTVFYDDKTEDYGKGYLYKNLIKSNSAIKFDIDTYDDDYSASSAAERLTTASVKLSLVYFDTMMANNGSTIRHKDLGFNF